MVNGSAEVPACAAICPRPSSREGGSETTAGLRRPQRRPARGCGRVHLHCVQDLPVHADSDEGDYELVAVDQAHRDGVLQDEHPESIELLAKVIDCRRELLEGDLDVVGLPSRGGGQDDGGSIMVVQE